MLHLFRSHYVCSMFQPCRQNVNLPSKLSIIQWIYGSINALPPHFSTSEQFLKLSRVTQKGSLGYFWSKCHFLKFLLYIAIKITLWKLEKYFCQNQLSVEWFKLHICRRVICSMCDVVILTSRNAKFYSLILYINIICIAKRLFGAYF